VSHFLNHDDIVEVGDRTLIFSQLTTYLKAGLSASDIRELLS